MYVRTQRESIDWRALAMLGPLAFLALFSQLAMAALHIDAQAPAVAARPGTGSTDPTFDTDRVVDQVSHAVTAVTGRPGAFTVPGAAYDATFDPTGVAVGGLQLAVSDIARSGTTPLAVRPGVWSSDANTAQRALAAGVTERVTASTAGVEWDVLLADRPAGTGDLTVTATLDGLQPGTAPVRGDAAWMLTVAGGGQVSIDELVVLDAAGTELYRALPTIAGDVLQLTVPASVLDDAEYPLTLDPTVASERLVSGAGTSIDDEELAIAFDGTNFLVVWETLNSGIYATRVTPGGAALDTPAIELQVFDGPQNPSVAFDGTNYLVVWEDSTGIAGRIVSRAGARGSEIQITAAAGLQYRPDVAFNGNSYVVVWEDRRNGTADIYGARVTTSGSVIDAAGIAISNAVGAQDGATVAYDGTNSLVVWSDARSGPDDIYGARVGPGGGVSDPGGIPISTATGEQRSPDIAFDGTNHLVVWGDNRSGTTFDIYGSRVSPAGAVLNPTGIAVSTAAREQGIPTVAYDGASYLVAWEDTRDRPSFGADVYATRVTTAGAVVTPAGTPVSTAATGAGVFSSGPAVGAGGGTFLLTWEDLRDWDDAYATRVSAAGVVLDPQGLRLSSQLPSTPQSEPVVAFDGTNYLVVWTQNNGTPDIWGTRVAPGGRVLDTEGFAISTAAGDQLQPAVAYGGGQFLVTWTNRVSGDDDVYMTKVSPAGVVANPGGVPVSSGAQYANKSTVAWNGSRFLVAWVDSRGGPVVNTIYAARVDAVGVQDPSGIQLSLTPAFETEPTVASNGSDFLVAWSDNRTPANGAEIWASRVTNAGVATAPGGFLVASRVGSQYLPAAAFDGTNYFVAYVQGAPTGERDVYGTRVSSAGAVIDGTTTGIAISTAPGDQTLPQIAFNGSYLVVWTQRNGSTQDEFFGARVATNGVVSDPTPFLIANGGASTGVFPERSAAVAKGPGGEWGFIHDRSFAGVYLRAVAPK